MSRIFKPPIKSLNIWKEIFLDKILQQVNAEKVNVDNDSNLFNRQ